MNPNTNRLLRRVPLFGIGIFLVLYIIAALLYPGGHYLNSQSQGFSMLHNYWCDLLEPLSINGQTNTGYIIAIAAMLLVCICLLPFWYILPNVGKYSQFEKAFVRICGMGAMIVTLFLFTRWHNTVILIAGPMGGAAIGLACIGLWRQRLYKLLGWAAICFILAGINFIIYQSRAGIIILPFLQKFTFCCCLGWFASILLHRPKT